VHSAPIISPKEDTLLTYEDIAARWQRSLERVKRELNLLERQGKLRIIRLGVRTARVYLSDLLRIEHGSTIVPSRQFPARKGQGHCRGSVDQNPSKKL